MYETTSIHVFPDTYVLRDAGHAVFMASGTFRVTELIAGVHRSTVTLHLSELGVDLLLRRRRRSAVTRPVARVRLLNENRELAIPVSIQSRIR